MNQEENMIDRNSKEELMRWLQNCLEKSEKLDDAEVLVLTRAGKRVINSGGLRGDVSETWRLLGFGPELIADMYL
jgi:hypothetical protein